MSNSRAFAVAVTRSDGALPHAGRAPSLSAWAGSATQPRGHYGVRAQLTVGGLLAPFQLPMNP